MQKRPPLVVGGVSVCVRRCPTFPPGLGSIIGAGRLSFRVRDGSGRFPVAVFAVTLFFGVVGGAGVRPAHGFLLVGGVVFCGLWLRGVVFTTFPVCVGFVCLL